VAVGGFTRRGEKYYIFVLHYAVADGGLHGADATETAVLYIQHGIAV
jgi:hypothetical protein